MHADLFIRLGLLWKLGLCQASTRYLVLPHPIADLDSDMG